MKKILIVEGNLREENESFSENGIQTHTESLKDSLSHFTDELSFDVVNPSSDQNIQLISDQLEQYDGLIWGGSSLNIYNNTPEIKRQIEEVFRSAVMRVPMDSASGTQILKFSGFTGREDHGILLHSRAMRKLGGADLDGDSAYFYMGGKGGFKKSWKDMFEAQSKEHHVMQSSKKTRKKLRYIETIIDDLELKIAGLYTRDKDMNLILKPGREKFLKRYQDELEKKKDAHSEVLTAEGREYLADNKPKDMEKILTEQYEGKRGERTAELIKSQAGLFSPNIRMMMAEAAIEGRANLGGAAVSPKNILSAAHQMLVDKGGSEIIEINGVNYRIKAKTSKEDLAYLRKLTRAMVGFSSDPMDYAGLKGFESWYRQMFLAHFDISAEAQKNLKTPLKGEEAFEKAGIWNLKKEGSIGLVEKSNLAYYGKDYKNNRQFTMEERHALTEQIKDMPYEQLNSMTTKIAKLLHPLDFSDNAIGRVNSKAVEKLFDVYHDSIRKYDYLMKAMQRTSFFAKSGPLINKFLNKDLRLWTMEGIVRAAKDPQLFSSIIKGTTFAKIKGVENYSTQERIGVLRRAREMASDFLSKNIDTLISVQKVDKYVRELKKENPELTMEQINQILSDTHAEVTRLKEASYLMGKERAEAIPEAEDPITFKEGTFEAQMGEAMDRGTARKGRPVSKGTTQADQQSIDREIRKFKRGKSEAEKKLFDMLMLGSLGRGNTKRPKAYCCRLNS